MTRRITRVVLLIPWDDEDQGHPLGWDFNTLLETGTHEVVEVLEAEDLLPEGDGDG